MEQEKKEKNTPEDLVLYAQYLMHKASDEYHTADSRVKSEHYKEEYRKMEHVRDGLKLYIMQGYADTFDDLFRAIEVNLTDSNISHDFVRCLHDLQSFLSKRIDIGDDIYADEGFTEWLAETGLGGSREIDASQEVEQEEVLSAWQISRMEADHDKVMGLDVPVENILSGIAILLNINDMEGEFPQFFKITEQTFTDKRAYRTFYR